MATRFVKELPPIAKRGTYERTPKPEHLRIAQALRKRPMEWAKVQSVNTSTHASHIANRIRNGVYLAFRPAGDFEAKGRGADVFARYTGPAA